MYPNMGGFDRVTRTAFGAAICAIGVVSGHWEMLVPAGLAVITGLVGYCPAYALFRFDTREDLECCEQERQKLRRAA